MIHSKAKLADLSRLLELLKQDELGQICESKLLLLDENYINAFHKIDCDPNHYLMVVENDGEIIATSHLITMPSLTFTGATRMHIEAVRVSSQYRNQKIGSWMFDQAILYAKANNVLILRLTTNKKRLKAINFYKKIGFEASHEGMKLYL